MRKTVRGAVLATAVAGMFLARGALAESGTTKTEAEEGAL